MTRWEEDEKGVDDEDMTLIEEGGKTKEEGHSKKNRRGPSEIGWHKRHANQEVKPGEKTSNATVPAEIEQDAVKAANAFLVIQTDQVGADPSIGLTNGEVGEEV